MERERGSQFMRRKDGRHPPQDNRGRSQDAMSSSNLDRLITFFEKTLDTQKNLM